MQLIWAASYMVFDVKAYLCLIKDMIKIRFFRCLLYQRQVCYCEHGCYRKKASVIIPCEKAGVVVSIRRCSEGTTPGACLAQRQIWISPFDFHRCGAQRRIMKPRGFCFAEKNYYAAKMSPRGMACGRGIVCCDHDNVGRNISVGERSEKMGPQGVDQCLGELMSS